MIVWTVSCVNGCSNRGLSEQPLRQNSSFLKGVVHIIVSIYPLERMIEESHTASLFIELKRSRTPMHFTILIIASSESAVS